MYFQLICAILAALALIFIARKYPVLAAIIYVFGLIYLVGFSNGRAGLGTVSIKLPMPFFRAIKEHHYGRVTNRSVLNVILFIPLGYLIPMLLVTFNNRRGVNGITKGQAQKASGQRWYKSWWLVTCVGLLCSLIIESSQLVFRFGVFELDDLIKNTMGTAIGWLIWKRGMKLQKRSANGESATVDN